MNCATCGKKLGLLESGTPIRDCPPLNQYKLCVTCHNMVARIIDGRNVDGDIQFFMSKIDAGTVDSLVVDFIRSAIDSALEQDTGDNESQKGFFDTSQVISAESVYQKTKQYLAPKDGFTHVVMINSFSKWLNRTFECETKYTNQIDCIITSMQKDGYDIIDVKFNSLMDQGLFGSMEGFHTLITYK